MTALAVFGAAILLVWVGSAICWMVRLWRSSSDR